MYKIQEFSKITGLPTTTLRYYDNEGLLKPLIRKENKYRYYGEVEYEKAKIIAVLRDNNFAIAEIRDVLMTIAQNNFGELSYYLIEKKAGLLAEIEEKKQQIDKIEEIVADTKIKLTPQEYEIKQVIKEKYYYIARTCNRPYHEMGTEVNLLYLAAKDKVAGELFIIDSDYDDPDTYIIGLPITEPIDDPTIMNRESDKQEGIQVTHSGSYENIGKAYKTLLDHVKKNHLKTNSLFLTTFIKGSGKLFKGNPNQYITEIFLPIMEESNF